MTKPSNKKQIYRDTKTGRNNLCPCGSKMKYKYCCVDKQKKQRIAQIKKNDEMVNTIEQHKFEQLIKKGIIVECKSSETLVVQKRGIT